MPQEDRAMLNFVEMLWRWDNKKYGGTLWPEARPVYRSVKAGEDSVR